MGVASRGPSIWRLAIWSVAGICLLLLLATSDSLTYVQRRMLLTAPVPTGRRAQEAAQPLVGRVGGTLVKLPAPAANSTAYRNAFQRCRLPAEGAPALPKLKRAGTWDGEYSSRHGNTTVVTTLHADRLPLLEAHCAVWPHTIVAAVYAPLSAARRVVCLTEGAGAEQLPSGAASWRAWLGMGTSAGAGAGDCPFAGWSVERLKRHVRQVQKRAQKTGQCNLRVELWTERVSEQLGPAVGLLPQAALQNRALLSMRPQEAEEHHAVVLLDSDMASVDIWQLVNWPSRWERALREMSAGRVLVLPAFQLTPAGVADAASHGEAAEVAAMRAALKVVTAEAGKFPLRELFKCSKAGVYADHGFAGSQDAALPLLWFEAGDMHGDDDDGYPVVPQPGFAPFTFMLQRHVPWADERLRGSYYQRAWQAMAARAMGLQHVVQPNAFAMQLPHGAGYSRGEAALRSFLQMEPVFRQMVEEVGSGEYVPVTSFGEECTLRDPGQEAEAAPAEEERRRS